MMDIVKHIKKHTESLQKGFENLSIEQVKQLKLMALVFYFKLPGWQMVIQQYINSPPKELSKKIIAKMESDGDFHDTLRANNLL